MDTIIKIWYAEIIELFKENLVSVIAYCNGWKPLELNEEMTVRFSDDAVYVIRRIK
jgi:hypothetical protein